MDQRPAQPGPPLLRRLANRLGLQRDWHLIIVAAGIGSITALGAIAFIAVLHALEDWMQGMASGGLWWVGLAPAVGALGTALLVHFFAREARGHGVPEVMMALYRRGGVIRARVALFKALASISTIASGGSAGAEGPIVQIGSALGSGLARLLRVPKDQVPTLLGCGAAAGIASVFNAPIAGVFFVLEILLRDFSVRTFTPIVVASVFSTAVTQAYYGQNDAIFAVSGALSGYEFSFPELPAYVVLGLVCALAAVGFTRSLYWVEDRYDGMKRVHPIVKPVTGALVLGGLGVVWMMAAGSTGSNVPAFFGNGYGTIRELLLPETYAADGAGVAGVRVTIVFLGLLALAKVVATCLTLGSGGSGGVFAPSLFLGAAVGACFGTVLDRAGVIPEGGSPAAYALVGMAAVVAGTTHAPLTAILILFELTRDVYVLLPIMLAAVIATVGAQVVMRDSIYSLKLRRRGVMVGTSADLSVLRRLTASSVAPVQAVELHPDEPLAKLSELRGHEHITDFVVTDAQGRYAGMVTAADLRAALQDPEAIPYLLVEELVRRDLPTIHPDEPLDLVMQMFATHDVNSLALVDDRREGSPVIGLITRGRLLERYQRELERT
jgi:CIC family chloride channel protein